MSTVEEIKAATANLKPEDQIELYRWLGEEKIFRQRQLEALREEIAIGIEQIERGESKVYDKQSLTNLAAQIKSEGRTRLAGQKGHDRP